MFGKKTRQLSGVRAAAIGLALAASGAAAQEDGAAAVPAAGINEAARLLAGMPGERSGSVGALAATQVWKIHADAMEQQWSRYERSTLKPMEEWSKAEIASRMKEGGVVRYMFSGPDILHAVRVFPRQGTYIMAGLEPVGVAPDLGKLDAKTIGRPLAEVRKALEEIIQFSFFKTIDMKVDLSQATFRGALPVMCLFLARSGIEIESLEYLKLAGDGSLGSLGGNPEGADAVRLVTAMDQAMNRKTIYYFQTDISNGKIGNTGFLKFLQSQPAGVSYVKAASYLMHNSYFSVIRDHLLAYSELLVEDDSGIPLSHFKPGEWEVTLFGTYTAPIPLFQEHYQADLRKAYQGGKPKALGFGTGYRWRKNDSNLLVGSRRADAPTAQAVAIVKAPPVDIAVAAVEPKADPAPASNPLVAVAEARPDPVAETGVMPATPVPAVAVEESVPETAATEVPVTPAVAAVTRPVSDNPVEVTLRLARKSDLPELDDLSSNILAVFEYEVVSVQRGDYPYKSMRLANGIVWGGKVSPQARSALGSTLSLEVVPLRTYPNLEKLRRIDTLDPAEGLPVFIPSM